MNENGENHFTLNFMKMVIEIVIEDNLKWGGGGRQFGGGVGGHGIFKTSAY